MTSLCEIYLIDDRKTKLHNSACWMHGTAWKENTIMSNNTPRNTIPPIVEATKSDAEILHELHDEIAKATNDLIPVLRLYVDDMRGIRMAIASEVREILRSSRELGEIRKQTPELIKFGEVLTTIKKLLTPEMMDLIKKLGKSNE